MQIRLIPILGIVLATGCSGADQNKIQEVISADSINITSAGSCYYKIDGVRQDDRTPIPSSDISQAILTSVNVREFFKTISIAFLTE